MLMITLPVWVFLSLPQIWSTWERLWMNRVRSLLNMRCILLGYSFELWPTNSYALGIAGSGMTSGLTKNKCLHSKNQRDERKQDWIVQKFGLQRPHDAGGGLLLSSSIKKKTKKNSFNRVADDLIYSKYLLIRLCAPSTISYANLYSRREEPWLRIT